LAVKLGKYALGKLREIRWGLIGDSDF